jgi:DNA-binding transcriptional MerR regulator
MKEASIPEESQGDLKRYYSIGEVAKLFGVSKSLIRFWEGEFDHLRPAKNSKGDRRFTPQNLEQFRLIYELVKERGFTIEGAKQEIKRHQEWEKEKKAVIERLERVRKGLEGLREGVE